MAEAPEVWKLIRCLLCNSEGGLTVDLDNGVTVRCVNCEESFTVVDVETTMAGWAKIIPLDGISGGGSTYSLEEAVNQISYSKNWDSLEQLHEAIRRWAVEANSGDVFVTPASVIVKCNVWEGIDAVEECPECGCVDLDYGEIEPVEGGDFEQKIECPECGVQWIDVFRLVERRKLFRKK